MIICGKNKNVFYLFLLKIYLIRWNECGGGMDIIRLKLILMDIVVF